MKKMLFAAALAASAGVACAQGYIGALVGLSRISVDCGDAATSCRTADTGFKVYGGYEVRPQIYAELAYTGFGTVEAQFGARQETFKARAWSLVGAYRRPLGHDLTGVARLGLAAVTTRHTLATSSRNSGSTIRLYTGLGLDYTLKDDIKIVSAFDLTSGNVAGETGALYLLGLGVQGEF